MDTTIDLTPIIAGFGAILLAIAGLITYYGKKLADRLDRVDKNAQDTADTLNHRAKGDPTIKLQMDQTLALSEKTHQEVTAIKVEARDARETSEKAHTAAMNAEKLAHETKSEVVEIKKIAEQLKGNSDTMLDYFSRLGKRHDDPPLNFDAQ